MDSDQLQDTGVARLLELNDSFIQARALHIAAELGIADLLADGPRGADELAAKTSTHSRALYRLLRTLAACGVFTEVDTGRFGLTPVGEHLRTNHPRSVRATIVGGGIFARAFVHAMHSMRTGTAAFPQSFGEPLFTYLQHHPEQSALFDAGMADLNRLASAAVVDALNGTKQVVDVGGGDGTLLSAILRARPETTGVVFDQPHVAETTRHKLHAHGLADRCTVISGDFFQQVPSGGGLYLLKWIIHDWPDTQAAVILRNCRRAMEPESRLVLVERVIPPGDIPHPSKVHDLAMLVLRGGQERTKDEYAALLAQSGLRLTRVVETASALSIIEAGPAPGEHG